MVRHFWARRERARTSGCRGDRSRAASRRRLACRDDVFTPRAQPRQVLTAAERRASQPRIRGQSVAEFALVLPLMILLLVGVADFARLFSAGIVLEAAARNAAEIGAQEYLKDPPSPPTTPVSTPSSWPPGYYARLHRLAAATACAESRVLPNTVYNTSTDACDGMPLFRVCVHDGADNECSADPFGSQPAPPECTGIVNPPTNAAPLVGEEQSHYAEVRACYRFTMLLRIPPLPFGVTPPIGDIWLQRTRIFPIADYYR
jgi:hypothetical protein